MNKAAKIYSFSVIYATTEQFLSRVPYLVGVVQRADGSKVSAFIEGYQEGRAVKTGEVVEEMYCEDHSIPRFALKAGA